MASKVFLFFRGCEVGDLNQVGGFLYKTDNGQINSIIKVESANFVLETDLLYFLVQRKGFVDKLEDLVKLIEFY